MTHVAGVHWVAGETVEPAAGMSTSECEGEEWNREQVMPKLEAPQVVVTTSYLNVVVVLQPIFHMIQKLKDVETL